MDRYRDLTWIPRCAITGPYKSNTSIKVIAGAITLACLVVGFMIGVMLLPW